MKRCTKCKKKKELDEFHHQSHTKDGRHTRCKNCQQKLAKKNYYANRQAKIDAAKANYRQTKDEMYRKKYGLYPGEYAAMSESQGHACAICKTKREDLVRSLAVDHDHKTGKIRGLLCGSCNTGLGRLGDSIEGLERAISYLRLTEA